MSFNLESNRPVATSRKKSLAGNFSSSFWMNKTARVLFLLIFLLSFWLYGQKPSLIRIQAESASDSQDHHTYLPLIMNSGQSVDCLTSGLGSILFTELTTGESTAPYLESLAQEGYTGLAATPTYDMGADHFGNLENWTRVFICNSHGCLTQKAQRAASEGVDYEYLAYDPERQEGVPDEEKYNLPWATQTAREIADAWGKPLMISYSTKQLHQEAEERGYDWNDPSEVVAMLAPYGDIWLIQAADEYWLLDDYTVRPILSQRVYPPGEEFRAEVQRWVGWIKSANPNIQIWIQLGMQRIGVPGENEPSADLLLAYRDSIADLVDGIYITPIYGSVEQFPLANQEMVEVFHQACTLQQTTLIPVTSITTEGDISLVEEGWSNDIPPICSPSGECLTILPGYYYWIYENSQYPCGAQGNHQFLVLDHENDPDTPKDLFVKFPGGAVGFWYYDEYMQRVYYPNPSASGLLTAQYFRNLFFRTSLSEEYAGGVTKKIRENQNFRIAVPSYCSHDLYLGQGEYNDIDGFNRWGYSAAMSAVDYVQQNFDTLQLITYGGSAGASGAFYIGKDQDSVAGIIMDSQAVDLSAISDACYDGYNVFGNSYPCYCPEGGPTCMEVLAPRISFTFYQDEPYRQIESDFNTPIYYVWNERDASIYAHLQFDNLHDALMQINPGGESIANKVCITDPRTPPGPICNLHVPSAFDFTDTYFLVRDIYGWVLSRLGYPPPIEVFLPLIAK